MAHQQQVAVTKGDIEHGRWSIRGFPHSMGNGRLGKEQKAVDGDRNSPTWDYCTGRDQAELSRWKIGALGR